MSLHLYLGTTFSREVILDWWSAVTPEKDSQLTIASKAYTVSLVLVCWASEWGVAPMLSAFSKVFPCERVRHSDLIYLPLRPEERQVHSLTHAGFRNETKWFYRYCKSYKSYLRVKNWRDITVFLGFFSPLTVADGRDGGRVYWNCFLIVAVSPRLDRKLSQ